MNWESTERGTLTQSGDGFATEMNDIVKSDESKILDFIPISIITIEDLMGKKLSRPLLCLLDSGASHTWIRQGVLPSGIKGKKETKTISQTLAGTLSGTQVLQVTAMRLPEFFRTRKIGPLQVRLFEANCRYDMVLGRDILNQLGILFNFKEKKISWDDCHVPMRQYPSNEEDPATRIYQDINVSP